MFPRYGRSRASSNNSCSSRATSSGSLTGRAISIYLSTLFQGPSILLHVRRLLQVLLHFSVQEVAIRDEMRSLALDLCY